MFAHLPGSTWLLLYLSLQHRRPYHQLTTEYEMPQRGTQSPEGHPARSSREWLHYPDLCLVSKLSEPSNQLSAAEECPVCKNQIANKLFRCLKHLKEPGKFRHNPRQLIVEYYLHWTTTFEIFLDQELVPKRC